jgi:hypothetical protein
VFHFAFCAIIAVLEKLAILAPYNLNDIGGGLEHRTPNIKVKSFGVSCYFSPIFAHF